MEYIRFIIRTVLFDFSRNKVRTILTSLGILIGVSSVVLLMAFGLGLKAYIKGQFENLGSNLVYVFPGVFGEGGGVGFRPGAFGGIRFDEKDFASLKKIKEAQAITGAFTRTVDISAQGKTKTIDIFAATPEIFPIRNFTVSAGRLFTDSDMDKRAKVTVLGPKLAKDLFGIENRALGKTVKIEKQSYAIIGVLEPKGGGGFGGPDFDSFAYIPFTSATQFNPKKEFIAFYIKAADEPTVKIIVEKAKQTLTKRYKEDKFAVVEQTEVLSTVTSIFTVLNSVLVGIGGISLIVGGVGIMNIMYVTVTERTAEIGIRRAIGATKRDIRIQFLSEAVVLSLVGGIAGLLLSFLVVLAINRFFPAYIDVTSVVLSLGVASLVGIVFGVLPARKAADLSPIDAIRYE